MKLVIMAVMSDSSDKIVFDGRSTNTKRSLERPLIFPCFWAPRKLRCETFWLCLHGIALIRQVQNFRLVLV